RSVTTFRSAVFPFTRPLRNFSPGLAWAHIQREKAGRTLFHIFSISRDACHLRRHQIRRSPLISMKAFILILLFLIPLSSMVSAQGTADGPVEVSKNIPPKAAAKHRDPSPKTAPVNIPLVEAKPVIEGILNDEVWRSAARFSDFVQTQPGDNIAPSSPVEA